MTFSAKTNLVGVVDEGKVVCTKPIVAEDEVRVAGHVEFHEGGLLVKATEDQTGCHRAASWAGGTVGLPDGRRVAGGEREAAGRREAKERLRKQWEAPESSKHLTRRRPVDVASQP